MLLSLEQRPRSNLTSVTGGTASHSCGHRNCPHCQNHESGQWIENELRKRLPAPYYLITFTLPSQLRDLAWKNQKKIYSLMCACVQDVLKSFTRNDKKLKGTAGVTIVLHTHSRRFDYHPHIHVIMPGAAINEKTGLWRVKSAGYLFSHKVFRAKLLEAIVDSGIRVPANCPKQWVVDCKEVGNGDKAVFYLGKYLYKGVHQMVTQPQLVVYTTTIRAIRPRFVMGTEFRFVCCKQKHSFLPAVFSPQGPGGIIRPGRPHLFYLLQKGNHCPEHNRLSHCPDSLGTRPLPPSQ